MPDSRHDEFRKIGRSSGLRAGITFGQRVESRFVILHLAGYSDAIYGGEIAVQPSLVCAVSRYSGTSGTAKSTISTAAGSWNVSEDVSTVITLLLGRND